jgi:hypothetical protein
MKKKIKSKPKKVAKKKKVVAKKKPVKKVLKKKAAKKKLAKKKKTTAAKPSKPIGTVTHFYNHISVAIVRFREVVPVGTVLHFKGATTDFKHPITSMQFNHEPVLKAPKGKQIGIKVRKRVREGDEVHRAE